jgi:alkanesulfonate monooxygenase SsuD/methylene tetrahydromethanopterin reductase-like flavin-dependent oxidoreductase (luciferase family)
VQLGLALPQYDFSVPGQPRLEWPTVVDWARRAEAAGFDSLWLSDHLVWAIDRYGGPPGNFEGYDPLPTLAALARATTITRLGTLVLAAPLRPPTVLAKALTSIDRVSHGRLDVGLGAGYFPPDFELAGLPLEPPRTRLERLAEATDVLQGCFVTAPNKPFDHRGQFYRATSLRNLPGPVQQPGPPIIYGGKGPRLVETAAAHADGWNTCWQWTPEDYAPRAEHARHALEENNRDPNDFALSLGLYTLVGEDEADLRRRFERLQQRSPPGVLDGVTLADYRHGRLVGTVEQVREQVAQWEALGVTLLIACLGAVPFSVSDPDDLAPVAAAVSRST